MFSLLLSFSSLPKAVYFPVGPSFFLIVKNQDKGSFFGKPEKRSSRKQALSSSTLVMGNLPHGREDLDGLVVSLARCPGHFVYVPRICMFRFQKAAKGEVRTII